MLDDTEVTGKPIKMDSSNNGRNRIAPLEIETLETICSEIGNQNVSPTFNKIEHSSVRQFSNTSDNKTDSIHYFSWLFGILLACTALLPTLIFPWHNVLKEPFYMYEVHVNSMIPWFVIIVGLYILRFEYWANIPYAKNWTSYFILCSIGSIIYTILFLIYFYIWGRS